VLETPVAIISISISPVAGSVALYCIAALINLTASSTSLFSIVSLSLILAIASEILIIDSSYLGVAVMVFFELPMLLIFVYS
jgi:hypothetical protein